MSVKWYQHFENNWHFIIELKTYLPFDPSTPLLRKMEKYIQKKIQECSFRKTSVIIINKLKTIKCPEKGMMSQVQRIHTIESHSEIKGSEALIHTACKISVTHW